MRIIWVKEDVSWWDFYIFFTQKKMNEQTHQKNNLLWAINVPFNFLLLFFLTFFFYFSNRSFSSSVEWVGIVGVIGRTKNDTQKGRLFRFHKWIIMIWLISNINVSINGKKFHWILASFNIIIIWVPANQHK